MTEGKKRDPFVGISFQGPPVSKQTYIDAYESYVKRCSQAIQKCDES